jgi:hypothetical protein
MASALHLATACDRCDRAWLARLRLGQIARCPYCDGPAAVLPGESYQAKDRALFESIASVVHGEQLTALASYQLWAILSNVAECELRPHLLLLPVFEAMPAVRFVQDACTRDDAQLAHGAGMILAAITAHLRALEARHPHPRATSAVLHDA